MVKYWLFLIAAVCLFTRCNSKKPIKPSNIKRMDVTNDLVPDDMTAMKIAEAIWLPIYGSKIYQEKPYTASLKDSIWIVEGTLPKGSDGGTAYIQIQKKDCKVLMVTHYK